MDPGTETQYRSHESGVYRSELLARMDFDRELLREIFELFKEEFPKSRLLGADAVELGDPEQMRNRTPLKGMLAGLSIGEASASAMRIEQIARQSAPEGIPEELAILESSVAAAQLYFDNVCRDVIR